jgi:hypothetical protein
VDKARFAYRINGLRDDVYAGKGLYPSWTVRGQKAALTKKTSSAHPVLWICRAFSTGACLKRWFCCLQNQFCRDDAAVNHAGQPVRVLTGSPGLTRHVRYFFFDQPLTTFFAMGWHRVLSVDKRKHAVTLPGRRRLSTRIASLF